MQGCTMDATPGFTPRYEVDCPTPCDEYDQINGLVDEWHHHVCYLGKHTTSGLTICAKPGKPGKFRRCEMGRLCKQVSKSKTVTQRLFDAVGPIHTTGVASLSKIS